MGRVQTVAVASAVALTVVLAAMSLNGGDRREVEELQAPLPSPFGEGFGFPGEEQARPLTPTKTGERGRDKFGMFTDDSLKLKRQQVMSELKGLRGLDAGVEKQMALLEQQESALKSAWHTTSSEMADSEAKKKLQHGREALASSGFPEVFHGAGLTAGSTVCEPWPRCCPRGNSDNCYGVISGGVLGAHTCSPYPSCCGTSISNCFDSQAVELTPSGSPVGPNPHDMAALTTVCEGPEKLKQCLTQTQRCMTPSADSAGNNADACTCFSSSLYCSFPQTPENCSPCPMACQQHIYDWFKATQDEMDGLPMQCALFEKALPDDDISALDDGSFRPYSWFSDKELHPEPIVAPLPDDEGVSTPPIKINWPDVKDWMFPKVEAPPTFSAYRPYARPAASPSYYPPHADRPKYYPPHQPLWSNYVNPKVAERQYIEAPYSYSFPHKSAIPPHMVDGYDYNKHLLDA